MSLMRSEIPRDGTQSERLGGEGAKKGVRGNEASN